VLTSEAWGMRREVLVLTTVSAASSVRWDMSIALAFCVHQTATMRAMIQGKLDQLSDNEL
jgi:hypothetical protein